MRKIRFKQAVAFVVFLLSVAAIASAIYMYSTVVEEKRYVYELRRKWTDSRICRTEEPGQGPDLGTYQTVEGRKQA